MPTLRVGISLGVSLRPDTPLARHIQRVEYYPPLRGRRLTPNVSPGENEAKNHNRRPS